MNILIELSYFFRIESNRGFFLFITKTKQRLDEAVLYLHSLIYELHAQISK